MEKAFTWRFGFDSVELRNFFKICQKQSNGECLIRYVSIHLCYISRDDWYNVRFVYTYLREASVARFDKSGNAKALQSEASNKC